MSRDLVGEKRERGNRERRRDDPLPRCRSDADDLSHDRVAETEWYRLRRHAREQLVRSTLGRFEILWRQTAHAVLRFRRAARRTLSAARARWRCVLTVPSGMASASATS